MHFNQCLFLFVHVLVWQRVPLVWANGQLNVNVFAGEWMSEWSVTGMNVIVLHVLCATQVENWTVLLLWGIHTHTHTHTHYGISVWERDKRGDRNKECPFRRLLSTLTGVKRSKGHKHPPNQCTFQQHYIRKYDLMCIRVQNNDGKVIQWWGKGGWGEEIRTKASEIISCQKKRLSNSNMWFISYGKRKRYSLPVLANIHKNIYTYVSKCSLYTFLL